MLIQTFDFFFRGSIILGLIVMIISNIRKVTKNRRANENKDVIKYYHTWLQHLPLYASYIGSALIGLSLLRVGSLLHFDSKGNVTLSIGKFLFLTKEQIVTNQLIFIIVGIVGALSFLLFAFLIARSFEELGTNFSSFIDIKKDNYLVRNGLYSTIRHPMYLSEIMLPLSASLTLVSWSVFLWTLFVILPLYILRAKKEDELLEHYYKEDFLTYKHSVGGFFPIIKK